MDRFYRVNDSQFIGFTVWNIDSKADDISVLLVDNDMTVLLDKNIKVKCNWNYDDSILVEYICNELGIELEDLNEPSDDELSELENL